MLEKLKNDKRFLFGGIGLVLVIIAVIVVVVLVTGSNENDLKKSLTNMGRDFYENYYYANIGNDEAKKKEYLERFKDIGIKINLDNLSRFKSEENDEKIKEFVNSKTKEACNAENTRVIIYPKEEYGKTDYEIKVELDCGFSKDK